MNKESGVILRIVEAFILLILMAILMAALVNVRRVGVDLGSERLEDAVRKTALACYAAEGVYPPNVEYLEENYGIQIDKSRYVVHYTAYAENLMPEIMVTVKTDD